MGSLTSTPLPNQNNTYIVCRREEGPVVQSPVGENRQAGFPMEPGCGEITCVHEHGRFAAQGAGRLCEWLFPSLPPGSLADKEKSTSKSHIQQWQCCILPGRGG